MSFNIVTWNINGIRSIQQDLRKIFDTLNADIICLQETKITRDMLDEPTAFVEGYTSYYSFSRKRSGYSGVATYCRETVTPVKAEEGIAGTFGPHNDPVGYYDHVHCQFTDEDLRNLDLEGRCIITQHTIQNGESISSVVIFNVYCPHAEADNEERMAYKLQFYKALELRCHDMIQQGFHVILLGDINTSHQLIDHCEPDDTDNFSQTPSRQWLSRFLSETDGGGKFIDAFRFLHPNREKSFTCWNTKTNARINNYGTRIDYILLSCKLGNSLKECTIMSDVYGSDHCPVKATLELTIIPSTKLPFICSRNFKEFTGKQLKMSTFFCKRSLTSSDEAAAVPQSKKMRTSKIKQSSIQAFFKQPSGDSPLVDEAPTSANAVTEVKITTTCPERNDTPSTAVQMWKTVFKGPPAPPTCKVHKEPCSLRTVKKRGPNMNRQFWTCSRAAGHTNDPQAQCNFFLWASSKR